GRSGRGEIPGEVLVKTRHPDHYLFKSLETNDQNLFYEKELEIRRRMSLPPFARMFTIELRGPSREKVEKTAEAIFDSLRNTGILGIQALGAGPNYFQKIRKNWRFQVVLRSLDLESPFPLEALGSVVAKHKKSGVSLRLHPDPQNLL
ncbi:MAG: hypothetical protein HY747_05225, partial [Elusimicrobia bacterium]|nr:hypothetical protein [Elusimicrobiota bacterium]